jgi:hypothetical protein
VDEDIVTIIALTLLISIPLLAISARIALKPIAEAIARLRGEPTAAPHARARQDRRLADLEEELRALRESVRFQSELQAPQEARRLHVSTSDTEAP